MSYTEREIDIYMAGLKDARRIALETGKGITASQAITQKLQLLSMQKERARQKGRFDHLQNSGPLTA